MLVCSRVNTTLMCVKHKKDKNNKLMHKYNIMSFCFKIYNGIEVYRYNAILSLGMRINLRLFLNSLIHSWSKVLKLKNNRELILEYLGSLRLVLVISVSD